MKRKLLFIKFLILIFIHAQSQLLFKINRDSVRTYSYSGGDEFNQNELDEKYWNNGLGWTRVLMSLDLAFSPKLVKQSDGILHLIAEKKDSIYTLGTYEIDSALLKKESLTLDKNAFLTKYAAGCIITRQKLHYGVYELRFKVEEGRGVWPAFWFYGGNKNDEIDAFELKGEQNHKIHVDTHCPNGCDNAYKDKYTLNRNWGGWLPISDYLHKGFNIMHLEWNKDEVVWMLNGYPLAYYKGEFSTPMNLYLNTSVAKDGGAFKPGPDATTTWPNTYYVDYFRIWQPVSTETKIVLQANELKQSEKFISTYDVKPLKKQGITFKKKEFDNLQGLIFFSLDRDNKLTVRISGKIRENISSAKLQIGGKEIELNAFRKEIQIEIPFSENLITLSIKNKQGIVQKQILLKR